MPTNVEGYSSLRAFFGLGLEAVLGTFSVPADADPATDAATTFTGGAQKMDAILGNIYESLTVPTTPRELGGTASGPFTNAALALTAALPDAITNDLNVYSIQIGLGGADATHFTTEHCVSSLIDTYTIRGQLGSIVTYAAAWKCLQIVAGSLTPTPPALTGTAAIGCVGVSYTGPTGVSGGGQGFEIAIANNIKSQGKYGQTAPVSIFSGGHGVTAKLTLFLTGAPFIPDDTLSQVQVVLQDDLSTPGTAATYTMALCRVTRAGRTVRAGSNTMQDVEVIASAEGGPPLVIT